MGIGLGIEFSGRLYNRCVSANSNSPSIDVQVEICIHASDRQAVRSSVGAAYRGGAARIELCSQMDQQGLTPTVELIGEARDAFGRRPGVLVMIRPRAGDFVYDSDELDLMATQIEQAASAGADGIVLGILRKDGTVDDEALEPLLQAARDRGLTVTFHRAFDAAADSGEALAQLLDLGVDRILTAGLPWGRAGSARDGADRIGRLCKSCQSIELVVGGGVNQENVCDILDRAATRVTPLSVHAYSGVRREMLTEQSLVRQLVQAVSDWSDRFNSS